MDKLYSNVQGSTGFQAHQKQTAGMQHMSGRIHTRMFFSEDEGQVCGDAVMQQ